ncbi:UpxY family transcription antiterminator [Mucilaginibacter sp. P25]|uniref:UpxY family transcription antiterminator n=1 Tax=Mucilaginibacter sp. P25 TaxID=3423945 RepID=UPI003D7A02ED
MNKFTNGWYLVYVKSNLENKISGLLLKSNIENFLPTYNSFRQWHDRKKKVTLPLFPNYIFVYLTSTSEYIACQKIEGVSGFIKFGKYPAIIPVSVIDQLKILNSPEINIGVTTESFKAGEVITIEHGILNGLTCEVVQHRGNNMVLVRVDLLNRNILVDIPTNNLISEEKSKINLTASRYRAA